MQAKWPQALLVRESAQFSLNRSVVRILCESYFVIEILLYYNEAPGSKILTNRMALSKEWHKGTTIVPNSNVYSEKAQNSDREPAYKNLIYITDFEKLLLSPWTSVISAGLVRNSRMHFRAMEADALYCIESGNTVFSFC